MLLYFMVCFEAYKQNLHKCHLGAHFVTSPIIFVNSLYTTHFMKQAKYSYNHFIATLATVIKTCAGNLTTLLSTKLMDVCTALEEL